MNQGILINGGGSRPWLGTIAICLFAIVLSYILFDYYVERSGLELVNAWLQSEMLDIQQGNLLTSLSKNQRLLLSSDVIRGLELSDRSRIQYDRLLQFGSHVPRIRVDSEKTIAAHTVGFFSHVITVRLPERPALIVSFFIYSSKVGAAFSIYSFILISLILNSMFWASKLERKEAKRRENLLKAALDSLINRQAPSADLVKLAPRLVQSLHELRLKLTESQNHDLHIRSSARLADHARQVAHDIRSPLTALNMAVPLMSSSIPPEHSDLLRSAVARINDIANSLLASGKTAVALEIEEEAIQQHPATLVDAVLVSICSEIRIQLRSDKVQIILDLDTDERGVRFVPINSGILSRVISNLIFNAVNAVGECGKVTVSLREYSDSVTICVADNGCGIPAALIPGLGDTPKSYGKDGANGSGSGLGLFHAKRAIAAANGSLAINSVEGLGTSVTIKLQKVIAPEWYQDEITVQPGTTFLVVDDDPSVHQVWRNFLKQNYGEAFALRAFTQTTDKDLRDCDSNLPRYAFVDFDLQNSESNGIEFIKEFDLLKRSLLVTSRWDDQGLQRHALRHGIKILPKFRAHRLKIRMEA